MCGCHFWQRDTEMNETTSADIGRRHSKEIGSEGTVRRSTGVNERWEEER